MNRLLFLVAIIAGGCIEIAQAGLSFANNSSSIVVHDGALNIAGMSLEDGTIRVLSDGQLVTSDPENVEDAGVSAACVGTTIQYEDEDGYTTFFVDGLLKTTGSAVGIVAGASDASHVIQVTGGQVDVPIVVSGSVSYPTILQGYGKLTSLAVNAGKKLELDWSGVLNVSLYAAGNSAIYSLKKDLTLGVGNGFSAASATDTTQCYFNGSFLSFGGEHDAPAVIANNQEWYSACIQLSGPVSLSAGCTVQLSDTAFFNGHGYSFSCDDETSVLDNDGADVTIINMVFDSVFDTTFIGEGNWIFNNVIFKNNSEELRVDGSCASGMAFFSGDVVFDAATIHLHKAYAPQGVFTLSNACKIVGKGHTLDFQSGLVLDVVEPVYISSTTLTSVGVDSILTDGGSSLFLSDVMWIDGVTDSAITITGNSDVFAQLELIDGQAGNIFGYSQFTDAYITLCTDIALESHWVCKGTTAINGQGNHIDLSAGTLNIPTGSSLYLSNVVLDNVAEGMAHHSLWNTAGTLHLSNVTIVLGDANVNWGGFSLTVIVDGPLTVVTDQYTLTLPFFPGVTTLNGVTAYYDTLGKEDITNLGGCAGSGRVLAVAPAVETSVMITEGTTVLEAHEFLAPLSNNAAGRVITFDGAVTYDGAGRIVYFPVVHEPVMTLNDDAVVTLTNIVLSGMSPGHLDISDTNGAVYYGDKTVIRLMSDWTLDTSIWCGSTALAEGESVVIDLNHFTIDMAHVDALIGLQGSVGTTLRLCNGRLCNLDQSKLVAAQDTKIILENITLSLSDDFTWSDAALEFQGVCIITGQSGAQFINTSLADFTIATGGSVTFTDGITYYHNNEAIDTIVFADVTAQLALIGATFKRANTTTDDVLSLTHGTFIADHTAVIDVGTKGIAFGNGDSDYNLTLVIHPAATIHKYGAGELSYLNLD